MATELRPTMTISSYSFDGGRLGFIGSRPEGKKGIYVPEGYIGISKNGEILESGQFKNYPVLIFQNRETKEACMVQTQGERLNFNQENFLYTLSPGKYSVTFICSAQSLYNAENMTEFMKKVNTDTVEAKLNSDIVVDSGDSALFVTYDPEERSAKVLVEDQKMVYEFFCAV